MSTVTVLPVPRPSVGALLRDYSELIKARVTTLIVITAWAGFYLAAAKTGVSSLSWSMFHAIVGIGLVSAGTAALNEVFERDVDALMRRTANRPLPAKRMSVAHATILATSMVVGGGAYLALMTNALAAILTLSTSLVYLAAYTPLKRYTTICTFIGAIPGAMPPVLGWVAARGVFEREALVLFAIMFFWQFPHFYAIAWLYRDDYRSAGIRMLPVVETTGYFTRFEIAGYALALIPATILPSLLHMAGRVYFVSAVVLGVGMLYYSIHASASPDPMSCPEAKHRARQLLKASVIYLPLLFAAMMLNAVS